MSSKVAEGSVRSAVLNILLAVLLRVITFGLNAFILRRVSTDILGLVNVRLTLLDDTILFLSREAFRRACLGFNGKKWGPIINLMWFCVPAGVFWSSLLGWAWLNLLPAPPPLLSSQYHSSVLLIGLSGVVEMLVQPVWVVGQVFMFHKLRVVMDFLWMVTRAVILATAVIFAPDKVLLYSSLGHLLSSILYVAGYYIFFYFWIKYKVTTEKKNDDETEDEKELPFTNIRELLPNISEGVSDEHCGVAVSFLSNGVVKQLLTEGEKYTMTVFSLLTLSQQGIYDVVANLGSLAARFLFRPIEESSNFFFSQLWKRQEAVDKQENIEEVTVGLFRLLRLMSLLGIIILTFGYSYSHLLLHLYGGSNLTLGSGPDLLRAQCLLVLFLAINGITECFSMAIMSQADIVKFNYKMGCMSVLYLALAWGLTKLVGPVGFVLANCCNMAVRIGHSVHVIHQTFKQTKYSPLSGLVPGPDIILFLLCAFICCQASELYIYPSFAMIHFVLGAIVFLLTLIFILMQEEFMLIFVVNKAKAVWSKVKRD